MSGQKPILQSVEEKRTKIVVIVKDCYYYYGIYPEAFKNKNYIDALNIKINAAHVLAEKLLINGYIACDVHRLNDVLDAVKFNKRLLKEIC